MNAEEQFHALAHKALSGEASAEERNELRRMTDSNPTLREEFRILKSDLDSINPFLELSTPRLHPADRIRPEPNAKLHDAVRSGLSSNRVPSKTHVANVIASLTAWSDGLSPADRESIQSAIQTIAHIFPEDGGRRLPVGLRGRRVQEGSGDADGQVVISAMTRHGTSTAHEAKDLLVAGRGLIDSLERNQAEMRNLINRLQAASDQTTRFREQAEQALAGLAHGLQS